MPDGRPNQRQRTRKDLLTAAAKLMQQGRTPTLDEVAEAAMVSRATAYRYFPGVEALLVEASVDVEVPEADVILRGANEDPIARLERVDDALSSTIGANEHALRTMLVHSLQRQAAGDDSVPKRQNRRTTLIEAALEPARADFKPADYKLLAKSLALVIGTESMLVFKDVLRVDDAEARKVKRFMIRALVQAARK